MLSSRVLLRILEYAYSLDDANLAGSPMVVTGLLGTQVSSDVTRFQCRC